MRLWIIGNGFDLHHKLKTSYKDYKAFLCKKYTCKRWDEVYKEHPDLIPEKVCPCCCRTDETVIRDHDAIQDCPVRRFNNLPRRVEKASEELWSDLEEACAIDFDKLMERGKGSYKRCDNPTTGMPLVANEYDVLGFAELFTGDLYYGWFCEIEKGLQKAKKNFQGQMLSVDTNDLFVTFNYTSTLQEFYEISDDPYDNHIHYVHGSMNDASKKYIELHKKGNPKKGKEIHKILAFGSPEVTKAALINAIDRYKRKEHICAKHIKILLRHGRELIRLLNKEIKPRLRMLKKFIKDHWGLLKNVDEVVVAGHSLSQIDSPYFNELAHKFCDKRWRFLCHNSCDMEKALKFCTDYKLTGMCVTWGCMARNPSKSSTDNQKPEISISWIK